jgi:hypothetical protein
MAWRRPARARRSCRLGLALVLLAAAGRASAQDYLGPSKCVQCHDHDRQAAKWQKEEPLAFKGKAHFSTLKQLDGAKAAGFARAVGLADPYALSGSCVKCHATVFRGDANAGVSCESCHGAASAWNELHQQKGSYVKAVAAGMRELRDKPAAIARVCVECHVLTDRRLAAAGHPTGEAFDAGVSLQKLVHWTRSYEFAQVSALARAAGAGRAPAAAPPTAAPASAARAGAGQPAAAPASAAVAPWDWSQPVRPLPQDYVPDAVAPSAPKATPAPPARVATTVPLSIAEDVPVASAPPVAATPAATEPTRLRPRAAEIAELRGQAAVLLERLLRAGARSPGAAAPSRPIEFAGPDGELLRLQDEAIALALEALRRP